ncbi:hypothetical protein J6590_037392 [Homalodisca vitripennis]|nr:hypothetical protein J6590_037392 [Homalodisca vitripennis]
MEPVISRLDESRAPLPYATTSFFTENRRWGVTSRKVGTKVTTGPLLPKIFVLYSTVYELVHYVDTATARCIVDMYDMSRVLAVCRAIEHVHAIGGTLVESTTGSRLALTQSVHVSERLVPNETTSVQFALLTNNYRSPILIPKIEIRHVPSMACSIESRWHATLIIFGKYPPHPECWEGEARAARTCRLPSAQMPACHYHGRTCVVRVARADPTLQQQQTQQYQLVQEALRLAMEKNTEFAALREEVLTLNILYIDEFKMERQKKSEFVLK